MFSSATQPPPPPTRCHPSRHNFVVSAITFEGFKLRSSNLTHALFIQISLMSSITDIVIQSNMAAGGHFVKKIKKKVAYRSEMARTVIELFLDIQNGRRRPFGPKFKKIIKIRMDLKWPEMPSKVNFGHPIWPIDQKWPEMRSKVIFGHPKWPPKKPNRIVYRSEMARIDIESEFQTSKMADRSEIARNAIKK